MSSDWWCLVGKPVPFKSASDAVRSPHFVKKTSLVAVDKTISHGPGFLVRDEEDARFFHDANGETWGLRVRCHVAPDGEGFPGSFSMSFEEFPEKP